MRTCTTPGCSKPHAAKGLCNTCDRRADYRADPVRHAARCKATRAKSVDKYRAIEKRSNRKCRTGWTEELFLEFQARQEGRCAICTREYGEGVCRDHTEREGVKTPRRLLCQACNLSLGYYEGWQRECGLVLEPYERYMALPPASAL